MPQRVPKYRMHKTTGRALVEIGGRRHYLGTYGSPESREEYHRLVAEHLGSGVRVPLAPGELTVARLVLLFLKHAEAYYSTSEYSNLKYATAPLVAMYGSTRPADFTAEQFEAMRGALIAGSAPRTRKWKKGKKGASRSHANGTMARVRQVFRWGTTKRRNGEPLVPAFVWQELRAVEPLKEGRTIARETEPVLPVEWKHVDAVLEHLTPTLRALVLLQWHTGHRAGELVALRGNDIQRDGDVWFFELADHKTAHKGGSPLRYIGPQGQAALAPLLKRRLPGAFLFSPAQSEKERLKALHEKRLRDGTPLSCGNRPGSNRKRNGRKFAPHYSTSSYRQALHRAARAAGVPQFNPHQIRHAFASRIGTQLDERGLQEALNHKVGSKTWAQYARPSEVRKTEIARRFG
ncbi:MAG: tyrosine-type recombinase/integrase [Planctomycetota bacterium]|jgi:integrase